MDPENNCDSDTSESWSMIDINSEYFGENLITDITGMGDQPQEVILREKSSAAAEEQAENGGSIALSNDLKNQQDFQLFYKSKMFDNSDGGKQSEPNTEEGEKVDPETKDLDEDTDGISVISESEYNEIKSTNYESDEESESKTSDSDEDESQTSDGSNKKKALMTNQGEGSEGTTNPRARRNIVSSVLNITMGIVFASVAFIAIGHFLGVHDSQETANNMVQTLKKLQTENFMLHTRLRQISEAVFGKTKEGHKSRGKSLPCKDHDADCIRAEVAKPENRYNEDDTPLSFFRRRDIDLSIPLHHPKNLVILQEILSGNEVHVLRKPREPVEPFNLTQYIKDLIRAQQVQYDDPETMSQIAAFLKLFRPTKKSAKEGESGKKLEPDDKEKKKNIETPDDKGCENDGGKVGDGENRKENCLAIREKDLSEFRWFLLNGKPKCSEAEIRNGADACGSKYFYKVPVGKGRSRSEELDELKTIIQKHNALMGRNRETKPTPRDKSGGYLFPKKRNVDVDEYGDAKLRNKYLKFPKPKNGKPDINTEKYIQQESEKKRKHIGPDVARNDHVAFSDKYLKYFEKVAEEAKKSEGKVIECTKEGGGKCELKLKKETNLPPNENRKMYTEKGANDDGEHKANKKDNVPEVNKGKIKSRPKRWKACSLPPAKCGNDSKCANCRSKSGDWFSKWAEGRERCRRHQKISGWQFERAKSRAHSRTGDAFWQFTRAYGRQNRRMHPLTRKRKFRQIFGKVYSIKSNSGE